MRPTDEAAREVEESRESYREWLSGPESFLAAISRHELPVGHSLRFGAKGDVELAEAGAAVTIAATDDGFRVDGFKRGPGIVRLGRYRLRLSHQNAPAVVIIDPDAKIEGPVALGEHAKVEALANIREYTVLGNNAVVKSGAFLHRTIVHDNAYISQGVRLRGSAVAA